MSPQPAACAVPAPAPALPRAPRQAQQPPAYPGALRVTGALTEDARLYPTTGRDPGLVLWLTLQPADGLPYTARVHLGTDLADHMDAEALLPQLRTGAVVSVAAQALHLRTEHGHPVLALAHPHSVVLLQHPVLPPAPQPAPAPQEP